MPMYEYTCQNCEHEFEKLVRSSDATVSCPKCESLRTVKRLSIPAKPVMAESGGMSLPTACGEGPPCGAPWCGRKG